MGIPSCMKGDWNWSHGVTMDSIQDVCSVTRTWLEIRSMLSRTSGRGPWLVMTYLLIMRKSPHKRTYGGVALDATVMLDATGDVEGMSK